MNFKDERQKKTGEIEQILKEYLPPQEGKQKIIMEAMVACGDVSDVWRYFKDRPAIYGGDRDDPYLFTRS